MMTRHARMMSAYRLEVETWHASREHANGHATELAEHDALNPAPRLADFMGGTF